MTRTASLVRSVLAGLVAVSLLGPALVGCDTKVKSTHKDPPADNGTPDKDKPEPIKRPRDDPG